MKKKKNKSRVYQPVRKAIGLDYKSLLKLLLTKYDDYKSVYETENEEAAKPFDIWLKELAEENVSKREKEKNVLKRKVSKCLDEAINLVFDTYNRDYPESDVPFYDFVNKMIS